MDPRKITFLLFISCALISLTYRGGETNRNSPPPIQAPADSLPENQSARVSTRQSLKYDFYSDSCPSAQKIIRSAVRELYNRQPSIAPAFIRLFFHDCFVQGCEASVLLDEADGENETEKYALPNQSLRGFNEIDMIKSEIENACPGIVSCADILVLAARESVMLAGGPFYPVYTGRRDGTSSSAAEAYNQLPAPQHGLSLTLASFAAKGFNARETVSLLGAHSTGNIHCKFFYDRLYNFSGSNEPDPSVDIQFLQTLRSTCNTSHSEDDIESNSSSQDQVMKMDYEGPGKSFGTLYYRSLLQGKGLLYADQQLTAGEETAHWVREYAADVLTFQNDFGRAMIKLSNLDVKTSPIGQVRSNCRKVN